ALPLGSRRRDHDFGRAHDLWIYRGTLRPHEMAACDRLWRRDRSFDRHRDPARRAALNEGELKMTGSQQGAVRAALIMCGGLLAVRIARAHGDVVLAGGLTLLEVGAIFFLEDRAKKLDQAISNWKRANETKARAMALAAEADQEGQRRQGMLAGVEQRIGG